MKTKSLVFIFLFSFVLLSTVSYASDMDRESSPLSFEINEIVRSDVHFEPLETTVPEDEKVELYTYFKNVGSSPFNFSSSVVIELGEVGSEDLVLEDEFDFNDSFSIGDIEEIFSVVDEDLSPGEYFVEAVIEYKAENTELVEEEGEDAGLDEGVEEFYYTFSVEEEETEPTDPSPTPSPPSPPKEPKEVGFLETVPFREVSQGDSMPIPMSFKNYGDGSVSVDLELEGPEEWLSLDFDRVRVQPGETRGFFLDIEVPYNQGQAAEKFVISAVDPNGDVLDKTSMYIRVKSVPEHRPMFKRGVYVDGREGSTEVLIDLWNPTDNTYEMVEITEKISGELPVSMDQIDFFPGTRETIEKDGRVKWRFLDVDPDESIEFGYSFDDEIPVGTNYGNWYTRDVSLQRSKFFEDIEVEEVEVATIGADGVGHSSFIIKNNMDVDIDYVVQPEVPENWSIDPWEADGVVESRGNETVDFLIRADSDVEVGTYEVVYNFLLDGSNLKRKQEVKVVETPIVPPFYWISLLFIIAVLVFVVVFFVLYKRRKKHGYSHRFSR